jgi:hypothetical protein
MLLQISLPAIPLLSTGSRERNGFANQRRSSAVISFLVVVSIFLKLDLLYTGALKISRGLAVSVEAPRCLVPCEGINEGCFWWQRKEPRHDKNCNNDKKSCSHLISHCDPACATAQSNSHTVSADQIPPRQVPARRHPSPPQQLEHRVLVVLVNFLDM